MTNDDEVARMLSEILENERRKYEELFASLHESMRQEEQDLLAVIAHERAKKIQKGLKNIRRQRRQLNYGHQNVET